MTTVRPVDVVSHFAYQYMYHIMHWKTKYNERIMAHRHTVTQSDTDRQTQRIVCKNQSLWKEISENMYQTSEN